MPPDLATSPCRRECLWAPTPDRRGEQTVFACGGCGSEWVRSEPWTPRDWTGEVSEPVQEERRRGAG